MTLFPVPASRDRIHKCIFYFLSPSPEFSWFSFPRNLQHFWNGLLSQDFLHQSSAHHGLPER
jgi:hypothetical protein